MPPEIQYLSYSSISAYEMCAKSWEWRYVIKPPVPTSPTLLFGTAFHEMVQTTIRWRLTDPQINVAEFFIDQWPEVWEEKIEKATEQGIDWNGASYEALRSDGFKMLAADGTRQFVETFEPLIVDDKPVIEQEIWLSIPGLPVRVKGFIDLRDKAGTCYDLKTAAPSRWNQQKAEEEVQPIFYLAALNQSEGLPIPRDGQMFRHVVFSKPTKSGQTVTTVYETRKTAGQVFRLFANVLEVWKGIAVESFPRSGKGTWKCSPKWCSYYPMCEGKV